MRIGLPAAARPLTASSSKQSSGSRRLREPLVRERSVRRSARRDGTRRTRRPARSSWAPPCCRRTRAIPSFKPTAPHRPPRRWAGPGSRSASARRTRLVIEDVYGLSYDEVGAHTEEYVTVLTHAAARRRRQPSRRALPCDIPTVQTSAATRQRHGLGAGTESAPGRRRADRWDDPVDGQRPIDRAPRGAEDQGGGVGRGSTGTSHRRRSSGRRARRRCGGP